ncbi:MAG: carboxylating nicotinate-nucleotide diphosphorylase [Gammaproteobacteria bacterium]|jgi:nicotinate-nucleotide pyrophosphorylase (carboxylating)|nr:carboxylating nicotinate-nucleotide diphosphorylase [Gammaproteobacteria bacterium]MDP6534822.1 carboxylating nicotinate-nucleotide diphosphorylase [Gammaproteobacteria bacterium]MDP6732235.1 carboxylating nicotinate-nucleotide diphosphorylase [Gammaproteobacteria bacterium]HAJ76132.1 carboxylating nicotinate-nucleotide diphosphorylase [Gammaproteobacteria bacterium]|tara:strand:- start:996 stop:1829 length:834 start_codon:yes stop_codon:yes gene_type:complete
MAISLPKDIAVIVRNALAEDVGSGDITAELIPAEKPASARLISREAGILCGIPWADEVFSQLDNTVTLQWQVQEGSRFEANQLLARLSGPARALLSGERTALNFLQTLSGTASYTHYLASLVAHTEVHLLDTRKTLPGLRSAQKYAVRTGGGYNHRMGLFDAYLIKENHIAACGSIEAAISAARELNPELPLEVEVQDLPQLQQALQAGADIILLDNFELMQLTEAVATNHGQCKLEASGSIDKDSLVKIAETGVDYISIGALTKHYRAIDLSMLLD